MTGPIVPVVRIQAADFDVAAEIDKADARPAMSARS